MEDKEVNIEDYINLYNKGLNLNRIKPLKNQTYKLFKNSEDIRIVHRKHTYSNALRYKKIEHLTKNNEYFYMIPITTIKGTHVGYILRGVLTSDYNTVTASLNLEYKVPFMYGFDHRFLIYDSYQKCHPIIVCEGCKDCITLKKIYPYVLSNNTSSMGLNSLILRNVSNRFLLAYDNDEAGLNGMNKDKSILRSMGAYVDTIKLPSEYKDCTDCYINPKTLEYNKDTFLSLAHQVKTKIKKLYEIE